MSESLDWSKGLGVLPYLDAFEGGAASAPVAFVREYARPQHTATPEALAEIITAATVYTEDVKALDWQERALCPETDPEAFFPEKGGSTKEAKKICAGCDVRAECLDYALANEERFGIWGGLSERERRKLKRRAA